MQYKSIYKSDLGNILIASDEVGVIGLWFQDAKNYAEGLDLNCKNFETPSITETKRWLDLYFSGKEPKFSPLLHVVGSSFRVKVWDILRKIPYGRTMSYLDIAKIIAENEGMKRMSAQAVGNAVGHNKISIIIPCHRVMGSDGSLIGYAGGLDRKKKLLEIEKVIK